tara:strand:- start:278 stop:448 length:171 start_codon:yes stop_codon:yes gene_type:complete
MIIKKDGHSAGTDIIYDHEKKSLCANVCAKIQNKDTLVGANLHNDGLAKFFISWKG